MTKISIIISASNDENLLKQSADSFLNQTLEDIELICLNNENSICLEEHDSIKTYSQNSITGEYVAYLNAGDIFKDENALERVWKDISKRNPDIITGDILEDKSNIELLKRLIDYPPFCVKMDDEVGWPMSFIKKSYLDEFTNGFDLINILNSYNYLNIFDYDEVRKSFVHMNITDEELKRFPFRLYGFYIRVLNCQTKGTFDIFNARIFNHFRYVDKKSLKEDLENFRELGINPDDDKRLIVSLTSYPDRMHDIHYCLYSLLTQSLKPFKVILWLAEDQFPNGEEDLPREVVRLKENGLTINWCEDLKSYKKLIPMLEMYPDYYVVTTDDDIYYPPNFLENIWMESQRYPNTIISSRSRKMALKEGKILDYENWEMIENGAKPSYTNFPTGAGGTLYPPKAFPDIVDDRELFEKLCPKGDDIWFWAMAVLNETKIATTKVNLNYLKYVNIARELGILDTEGTLWSGNKNDENNRQIRNVVGHFPEILERITNE